MMQIGQGILPKNGLIKIGSWGHLMIFIWMLAMVMVVPQQHMLLVAAVCVIVSAVVYPSIFSRMLNLRLIFMSLILMIPPMFFFGEADQVFLGIPISIEGIAVGLQAGVRFWVVLMAVFGFTQSVDIPSMAGILERFGLQGLGFTIGVALNLVPSLKDAAEKSWYSLKMRGGFRRKWFRGVQLFLVIVISNALRRAEEIALAAESRAFSPENARPMAMKHSRMDWLVLPICLASFIAVLLWT